LRSFPDTRNRVHFAAVPFRVTASEPRDPFDLQRFVTAQNPVYAQVCAELRAGWKTSHWMWFIFRQFRGLGHRAMATKFGISSREEAEAYLDHATLAESWPCNLVRF
jgi:uncharacterized protein (DUF1810 family)